VDTFRFFPTGPPRQVSPRLSPPWQYISPWPREAQRNGGFHHPSNQKHVQHITPEKQSVGGLVVYPIIIPLFTGFCSYIPSGWPWDFLNQSTAATENPPCSIGNASSN